MENYKWGLLADGRKGMRLDYSPPKWHLFKRHVETRFNKVSSMEDGQYYAVCSRGDPLDRAFQRSCIAPPVTVRCQRYSAIYNKIIARGEGGK